MERDFRISETSELGQRLAPIRERHAERGGLDQSEDEAKAGLPIVNDIAYQILGAQLNLPYDSHSDTEHPFWKGLDVAKGIFKSIRRYDNGEVFVEGAHGWIRNKLGREKASARDSATIGMGIVLRAFEIQNPAIVQRIQTIKKSEIDQSFERIGNIGRGDILDEVLDNAEIPDYQMHLNDIVGQMAPLCDGRNRVYEGAVVMYKVLESLHEQGHL